MYGIADWHAAALAHGGHAAAVRAAAVQMASCSRTELSVLYSRAHCSDPVCVWLHRGVWLVLRSSTWYLTRALWVPPSHLLAR